MIPGGGVFRKLVHELRVGGIGGPWRALQARRRIRAIERRDPRDEYRRWLDRHRDRFEAPPPTPPGPAPGDDVVLLRFGSEGPAPSATPGMEGVAGVRIVPVPPGSDGWKGTRAARVLGVDAEDRLAPHAVARLLAAFPADTGVASRSVVYADEDLLAADGSRGAPFLKPAWSPCLARSLPGVYPGAPVAIGGALWERVAADAGSWADAVGRAAEAADTVVHVPIPLLSRRVASSGPVASRPASADAARPAGRPVVSVVLPTRDRPDLLGPALDGVLAEAGDVDLDLVVVDHATRDTEALRRLAALERDGRGRLVRDDGPFAYSRLVNRGAALARGDTILLLNNDVVPRTAGWLARLVETIAWPNVAATGPGLAYPDGRVQHAGIGLGLGTVTGHLHRGARPDAGSPTVGPRVVREVAALTGACLLVRRDLWEALGGLDEARLPVAFSDVDLCLRLRERGWTVVLRGDVELVHHETATRAPWLDPAEVRFMLDRWGDALARDPYLPPGLSRLTEIPHLELDEDFPIEPRAVHRPVQRSGSDSTRA